MSKFAEKHSLKGHSFQPSQLYSQSTTYNEPKALKGLVSRPNSLHWVSGVKSPENSLSDYIQYEPKSSKSSILSIIGKDVNGEYFKKELNTGEVRKIPVHENLSIGKQSLFTWTKQNHRELRNYEILLHSVMQNRFLNERRFFLKMGTLTSVDTMTQSEFIENSQKLIHNLVNCYQMTALIYGFEPHKDKRLHIHILGIITQDGKEKLWQKDGTLTRVNGISLLYGGSTNAFEFEKQSDRPRKTYVSKSGSDTLSAIYLSKEYDLKAELSIPVHVCGHRGMSCVKPITLKNSITDLRSKDLHDPEGSVFHSVSYDIQKYQAAKLAVSIAEKLGDKATKKAYSFIKKFESNYV